MIVNASIYRPDRSPFKGSGRDKAECTVLDCSNSENCGLYARGECSLLAPLLSIQRCPYGKLKTETGFTKRARAYYTWVTEREEKYKGKINKLKWNKSIMTEIGDYVFLPYSHITMNEAIPFKAHGGFMSNGNCFLLKEHFTIENIISICEFKPRALIGGEIKTYQKEEVPKFILHLSEQMPDVFKKLCKKYPRAKQTIKEHTNVGRKALLKTLTPNVGKFVDCHKANWTWDGEYITSNNSHASFMLTSNFSEVRVKPEGDCEVKITDDAQVNENTKFLS